MTPEQIVLSLFTAVESGDLDAIGTHFAENATYSNIPYEPAVGRNAIIEMFRPIGRAANVSNGKFAPLRPLSIVCIASGSIVFGSRVKNMRCPVIAWLR